MKPADYLMLVVAFVAVAAVALQLWRGTKRKDDTGINFSRIVCPKCGEPAPLMRTPTSFRQMLLGGITCAKCGTEMDKWGREIARR